MARAKPKPAAIASTNGVHPPTFKVSTRYAQPSTLVKLMDPSIWRGQEPVDTGGRVRILRFDSQVAEDVRARVREEFGIGENGEFTPDQANTNALEQLIAVTVAGNEWNLVDDDDQLIPITEASVRAMYTDPRTEWIYVQVRSAFTDLARFFGTGTPN